MADVLVNIRGNTQQATAAINDTTGAVDNLNSAAAQAANKVDDLDASLKKQEANIKIIDGAVNLLGGSIEVAVGTLGLLGVDEGIIEDFEKTALSAIAFADGTKRALDGVKSLNEGLSNYGGIAGAARKAQAALNAVVAANPWILLAAAVAAVGAALIAYYNTQVEAEEAEKSGAAAIEKGIEAKKKAKEETDRLRESLDEYVKTLGEAARAADRELALAQAQGKSEKELLEIRKRAIQERINDLNRQLGFVIDNAELEEEIREKIKDEENNLQIALADFAQKRKDREEKAAQDRFDRLNKENTDRENAIRTHEENVTRIAKTAREQRLADAKFLADAQAEEDREAFEKDLENLRKRKEAGDQAARTAQEQADALVNARVTLLSNTAQAVGALTSLFEEGTAAYKVAALAEIAIGTATGFISALDIAQKSAKATGPAAAFAFPIFYASQIAAVLGAVASAKQVLATTPGGGGNIPNARPSGGGSPSFAGPGATPLGGGFQGAPTPVVTPTEGPIRAYVVSGDVTNAQVADGQIRRRRTLGPG